MPLGRDNMRTYNSCGDVFLRFWVFLMGDPENWGSMDGAFSLWVFFGMIRFFFEYGDGFD